MSNKSRIKFSMFTNGTLFSFLITGTIILVGCIPVQSTSNATPTSSLQLISSPTISPRATLLAPAPTPTASPISLLPGSYITYWSQGTWYIKEVHSTSSVKLIPGVSSVINPDMRISPDGNMVAYSSVPGQISIYDLRTDEINYFSNTDVSGIYNFVWSPDGSVLLYLGTPEEIWIPDAYVGIYGISLITKKMFTIINWSNDIFEYGLGGMSISRDGRTLAFYAPRASEMMTLDPKYVVYSVETVCFDNPATCSESIQSVGDGRNPTWSPSGNLDWVCFEGMKSALCTVDVNNLTKPQTILTTEDLAMPLETEIRDFYWSPDGSNIVINVQYHQNSGLNDITQEAILFPIDRGLPTKIISPIPGQGSCVGWSPDGSFLACYGVLGYSEPIGVVGAIRPITDLHIYDVLYGRMIDLVEKPGNLEVFGFFVNIE